MKVIYDENGIIIGASNDPREISDVTTTLSYDEVFDYKVNLETKELYYSPRVVEPESLEDLKLSKIKQVQDNFSEFVKSKEAKYSNEEVATFVSQQADALAWEADNAAPTPILSRMANGDEEFRLALIQAVLANIEEVSVAQGGMVIKRDMIKACTTQEELDAIDI